MRPDLMTSIIGSVWAIFGTVKLLQNDPNCYSLLILSTLLFILAELQAIRLK